MAVNSPNHKKITCHRKQSFQIETHLSSMLWCPRGILQETVIPSLTRHVRHVGSPSPRDYRTMTQRIVVCDLLSSNTSWILETILNLRKCYNCVTHDINLVIEKAQFCPGKSTKMKITNVICHRAFQLLNIGIEIGFGSSFSASNDMCVCSSP